LSQQYNLPKFKQISATQEKGLHGSNFITLGKISEDEKIEIIQTRNEVPFFRISTSSGRQNIFEEVL
jgi:hypothetical protein